MFASSISVMSKRALPSKAATVRAAIYVRISRDSEGDGLGVKRQRADCEKLAATLGWVVVDVYEDNDVSASKSRPRPDYERMMRDVRTGRINAVIVWDVDRLTRKPRELEDVIDFADKYGLRLASVGGDIDLATEQGRMMARMKGTVARYEVEQARRRLKSKQAELAEAGRYNGPRPYGWTLTGKGKNQQLVVNEAEAMVIRECVRRVLRGEGIWKIRNDLNARGITTATGGPWQTQTLRRMLLRWTNCGYRQHQPRDREGKPLGRPSLHRGAWAAIIDRETHERVVATLTDPARRTNNRGTAEKYLLTGIALCGECMRPLVGVAEHSYEVKVQRKDGPTTRVRRYPAAYKCPHAGCMKINRRMEDLDRFVEEVVIDLLDREGIRLLGGDHEAAEDARRRLKELQAKLDLAADKFADGEWTDEQVDRINARVKPQIAAEEVRLRRAEPPEHLKEYAGKSGAAKWLGDDIDRRRQILRVLKVTPILDPVGPGRGATPVEDCVRFGEVAKSA